MQWQSPQAVLLILAHSLQLQT